MSREFEIAREVDLPAAPDDVWTAITADPAAWQFPTGMEIPAGAAPPEGAPGRSTSRVISNSRLMTGAPWAW